LGKSSRFLYSEPMIGKLSGHYAGETGDGSVLVDVGGVGYVVRLAQASLVTIPEGASVSLYIHTAVREDAIELYGFSSRDALAFFKTLMSVSGIGPKTALGIMSGADISSLRRAIARGDSTSLVKLYGIGRKNAERLVVELKDKILLSVRDDSSATSKDSVATDDTSEILDALEALGYSAPECRRAVRSIPPSAVTMQEQITHALKELAAPAHRG